MLPSNKWKLDSIVRLLVSLFICIYMGMLAGALFEHFQGVPARFPFFLVVLCGIGCLGTALVLVRLPVTKENLVLRAAIAMTCFYAGLVLAAWAHKMAPLPKNSVVLMILSALSFQGATILLVGIFLRDQQTTWAEGFGFNRKVWVALLLGVVAGLAFLPVGWMLQWLSAGVMQHLPRILPEPVEQQSVQILKNAGTVYHKIALGITTIFLAPLAEELLFRGIAYKWIRDLGFPRLGLWIVSIIFAGIHFNAASFLPLVLLSVLLVLLYERTGNLLASIMAHATFNAMNFTMLYLMWPETA